VTGQDAADGTPFGRYRLVELLGRGGMGEVWRAHDTVTDRVVAIKVLPAKLSEDEDFQKRFRREAHAAARLNSPHVVPIHDYGEIDGRLFVSMRLIEGRDLDTVLADGPLQPARAVRIIDQVAKALHAAHRVGLIHRDIKPSNILLDDDDFAYLIDFGIARVADDTRLTKTGSMIGTFAYIAPERLDGRAEEDARADIYSLACVLYEALTGEPPFAGSTTTQLMYAHAHTPPPRPSTTQSDVPAQFDAVIARGMAKGPDQRYATTIELADAARDAITAPIERTSPRPATLRAAEQAPLPATGRAGGNHFNAQPSTLMAGSPAPAKQAPPPQPVAPNPPGQPWWRRRAIVIPAALVTVAVIAAIVITSQQHKNSNGPQSLPTTSTQHREPAYGPQVTLPFTGLDAPVGVAVDAAGDVYVAEYRNNRVVKLAAGSSTQTMLPFTGLYYPDGVAVDSAGNLYVADADNNRVVKLPAG
jgi:serine/threonine protein kinase, bacterial